MNLQQIPFYISYETYTQFIRTNFSQLTLTDDTLFLGYIFVQFLFIFCLYLLVKLIKFFILYIGNNIL